jgi:hypothetical protein
VPSYVLEPPDPTVDERFWLAYQEEASAWLRWGTALSETLLAIQARTGGAQLTQSQISAVLRHKRRFLQEKGVNGLPAEVVDADRFDSSWVLSAEIRDLRRDPRRPWGELDVTRSAPWICLDVLTMVMPPCDRKTLQAAIALKRGIKPSTVNRQVNDLIKWGCVRAQDGTLQPWKHHGRAVEDLRLLTLHAAPPSPAGLRPGPHR